MWPLGNFKTEGVTIELFGTNEYQLQDRKKNVNTCGRWVILRLKYPKISVNDFYDIFKESSKYINNDELITHLVNI